MKRRIASAMTTTSPAMRAATAAVAARHSFQHRQYCDRRVVLCADFDQTLTVRDTITLLFQRATDRQSSSSRSAHTAEVQRVIEQYMADLRLLEPLDQGEHNRAANSPSADGECSVELRPTRFDAFGLGAYLDRFAAVDLQSIERVIAARLLQGIHREDLVANAAQIELQPACIDALTSADAAYAVSANWSTVMLGAALNSAAAAAAGGSDKDADAVRRPIKIIANDLEVDAAGVTTGAIELHVQSPRDKARCVQQIRAAETTTRDSNSSSDDTLLPLVVFVGDSANDVLAMLEADVGVALACAGSTSLEQLATRFGVALQPLSDGASLVDCAAVSDAARARNERVLFAAENWWTIQRAMR